MGTYKLNVVLLEVRIFGVDLGDEMRKREVWRAVKGYPGYTVSSHGRVCSRRRGSPYMIHIGLSSNGYPTVRLSPGKRGQGMNILVHRLVLEAFVGPRPAGCQAFHLDGDRKNNKLANLEWRSPADVPNRPSPGEANGRSKLNDIMVRDIREAREAGASIKALAEIYEVTPPTISAIVHRRTWRHVHA